MALTPDRFLSNTRFKAIFENAASLIERQRPLLYLDWVPKVNAMDDELIGRFTGRVYIADIIAPDSRAVVRDSGKIEITTHTLPKIKIGYKTEESKLAMIDKLTNGFSLTPSEENALLDWEVMQAENLVLGVRQQMNNMICAMLQDSFVYDNLGTKLSMSWGVPSALKITPTYAWTDTSNADPFGDIFTLKNRMMDTYGKRADTLIMSSLAVDAMASCAKFWQRASSNYGRAFSMTADLTIVKDRQSVMNAITQVSGLKIEIDDATYNVETNGGAYQSRRYLPTNKVLVLNSQDKGNSRTWDFGNGVVQEATLGSAMGIDGFGGQQYGPISYRTYPQDLNPPELTHWAVAKGLPRKHVTEASGYITIATSPLT